VTGKAFYIETFGCQMNAHDSEKVVGTLLAKGYSQVDTPEAADLVLYNTCSIRDKAEQKVFNRLQNFKRAAGKGKVFGVLGCVAQQEGEKISSGRRTSAWWPVRPVTPGCPRCWCSWRRAIGASPG
jgi:tRNA-2-methylthio-N6-dimethylallyladenosine synthase